MLHGKKTTKCTNIAAHYRKGVTGANKRSIMKHVKKATNFNIDN